MSLPSELRAIHKDIVSCNHCPRLRDHCLEIARTKRRAFLKDTYWGKPVTGFGDPKAGLMIIGLAPAAHGANRTGRIFTGDRSGEWLYRALYKAGFSNQPESTNIDDGLILKNAYVTCAVRCAPPENKPTPSEQAQCAFYLERELKYFSSTTRVWIALGQFAYHSLWLYLASAGHTKRPEFKHGLSIPLDSGRVLLLSYHPSQQNTFTGKLTEPMFDSVFSKAREVLDR